MRTLAVLGNTFCCCNDVKPSRLIDTALEPQNDRAERGGGLIKLKTYTPELLARNQRERYTIRKQVYYCYHCNLPT